MIYLLFFPLFFLFMLLYFRVADHYNIIDHPNERSSHTRVTIRGGGIIFLFAALSILILYPQYWLLVSGMFIAGMISFLDDVFTLSGKIRILFHLASVTLLFLFFKLFSFLPIYDCVLFYILFIGVINAYNFMDGINGITGSYSLVVLLGIQYVNFHLQRGRFIDPDLIWLPIAACVVFLFFNFRVKAKCFAGDVGAVSIAFWITMLLSDLIIKTDNPGYVLFLAVYGVDSIFTIIHRIILKQNIFKAHRLHLYQLLANENKVPHLIVSSIYAIVQLLIIVIVITFKQLPFPNLFIIVIAPLATIYLWLKPRLMRILVNKTP